jgi:hypothetical protein
VIPQVEKANPAHIFEGRILQFDDPTIPQAAGINLTTLVRRDRGWDCHAAAAGRLVPLPRRPGDPNHKGETRVLYDPETNMVSIAQDDKIVETFPLRGQSRSLFLDGSGDPDADFHVQPFGGILTEVNSLNSLAIDNSGRNSELLHFCECQRII